MITVLLLILKSLVTNLIIYFFVKKSKDRELLELAKDVVLFKINEGHELPKGTAFVRRYWIGKFITSSIMFVGMYFLLLSFITVKTLVSIPIYLFRLCATSKICL